MLRGQEGDDNAEGEEDEVGDEIGEEVEPEVRPEGLLVLRSKFRADGHTHPLFRRYFIGYVSHTLP